MTRQAEQKGVGESQSMLLRAAPVDGLHLDLHAALQRQLAHEQVRLLAVRLLLHV